MLKAAISAKLMIKDSWGNWLQSSVTERIRAMFGLVFFVVCFFVFFLRRCFPAYNVDLLLLGSGWPGNQDQY